jgi:predicted YcjX-like family ATPase
MSNGRRKARAVAPRARARLATQWHAHLATLDASGREDEQATLTAAKLFTDYLRACRDERFAMSLLPPGRFLMPGNLAGSPALTFAPLDVRPDGAAPDGSLWAMMKRRYEAYKDVVVRPFFRNHFSRLDRQIVLVDALAAFNAGPEALQDLEGALSGILDCFNVGRSTFLNALFRPRIDKILFAATKADHLHHTSHDRLEAILKRMVERAASRAAFAGASVDVVALAAVRATREALVQQGRDKLPSILGTPEEGDVRWRSLRRRNRGGDVPRRSSGQAGRSVQRRRFKGLTNTASDQTDFRFLRFRPPLLAREGGEEPALPHIRLDRALQFLIGDKLQ